jgi:hypothetical protein
MNEKEKNAKKGDVVLSFYCTVYTLPLHTLVQLPGVDVV